MNDDDFTISTQSVSVFFNEEQMGRIDRLYGELDGTDEAKVDMDLFLYQWIQQSPHLFVSYSLYDDVCKENEQTTFNYVDIKQKIAQKQISNGRRNI